MSKRRIALLALASLLLGGIAGFIYDQARIRPAQEWFTATGWLAMYGDFSWEQYLNADPASAREALENYVKYCKTVLQKNDRWQVRFDLGLANWRLALLAEAAGNKTQSRQYMDEAKRNFSLAGWSLSEEKIQIALQKADAGLPQSGFPQVIPQ